MAERMVILGAGESGVGAAILAKQQGWEVFVSDGGVIAPKYKTVLQEHAIAFEEGSHNAGKILDADEVMKSPGIPEKNELVKEIRKKGNRSKCQCDVSILRFRREILSAERRSSAGGILTFGVGSANLLLPGWGPVLMTD